MSDHKGARLILEALPPAKALLADRGYDSNWFRAAQTRLRALHTFHQKPKNPAPPVSDRPPYQPIEPR